LLPSTLPRSRYDAQVSPASVIIAARFCGPEHSGNGGYCAGRFAQALVPVVAAGDSGDGVPAPEITLRRPPPLERPLIVDDSSWPADATVRVLADDAVVAEVRWTTIEPWERAWPAGTPVPSFAEAQAWSTHFIGHGQHSFPFCFVCGNGRAPGDGLRIFPGRVQAEGVVAAPWTPHASVADSAGRVPDEIVWAALDCTGYFGVYQPGCPNALLGRMAAVVRGQVAVREPCVVTGWSQGGGGRKRFAGTALHGADGRLVGWSRQVWITV
jgi:hypothetical protein